MTIPTSHKARHHVYYLDGVDPDSVQLPEDNELVMPDVAVSFEKPITDQWIHAELNVSQGELPQKEKNIFRTNDGNSDSTVSYDPNIFVNDMSYDAEFFYR